MPTSEPPPADDRSIPAEARLWRRVFPKQRYWDEEQKRWRPASSAFRDHDPEDPGLSAYIVGETTVEAALEKGPGMDLVEFPAVVARNKSCTIIRDEKDEKGHTLIFGAGTAWKLTKGQAEEIAANSQYVVPDQSDMPIPPP
jgi:hypothetical protein